MSADELKKVNLTDWEEKISPHPGINYVYLLQEVEEYLKKMEDILSEGNMSGLDYQSQEGKIEDIGTGIGYLNSYISSLAWELDEKIDQPLYQGFQNDATEFLSRIRMEEYTTDNTLQIRRHQEMHEENGSPLSFDSVAASLSMKDFLGLNGLGGDDTAGNLVWIPKEFRDFTSLFAADYDTIKESLKDESGRQITLEEYLGTLDVYGEFDSEMDKPVLEFVSSVLDVTIIKPVIEMCTGYDLITQEDLSDLERGMKGGFAAVDAVTLLIGIKASAGVKFFSKDALKLAGKTMAVDMLANGTSYVVGKAGEEWGLPLPVTLLLSLGAGMTVSIKAGKYVFRDSAGNVLLEAGEQEVEAIKRAGGADDIPTAFKQKSFASSYESRINQTPALSNKKVQFIEVDARGETMCILKPPPDKELEEILNNAGIKGIMYKNGVPDFTPTAKIELEINNMVGGTGSMGNAARKSNFKQANEALAEQLNNSPDLAKKFGMNSGNIKASDIEKYRVKNNLTWHELNNGTTMQLVPTAINNSFGHLGGVGEINAGLFKN